MKKGINCWCFPGDFTIERIFKISKDAGFDGVEINMDESVGFKENAALTLDSKRDDILRINELAQRYGLEIPSVSSSLLWKYPLTDSDERIQEKAKEIVRKMIDAAEILGSNTVLVVPGVVNDSVSYKKAYMRALDNLTELSKYAEQKKVSIGVENVWNKFLLSPIEMRQFLEKINSPYVGAYFDVGNVVAFSYPKYWIEILAGMIKKVHVKDFNTSIGNINGFTYLLQGDVNWPGVIEALRNVGYQDYLTAELTPYKLFPDKLAYDAADALERIIGSV